MYPYNGRPTGEFLREYRDKLNELQELMESQGLKLQIKDGGRCIVLPEVKAGLGEAGAGSKDSSDNSFMLAYRGCEKSGIAYFQLSLALVLFWR